MKAERAVFLHQALRPKRRTRIVDVGANPLGETPYSTLLQNGLCDVWGFEPQEGAYRRLLEESGEHETYLPYAIGDGSAATLHVCGGGGFTSIYQPSTDFLALIGRWHSGLEVKERVDIQTYRLDDLECVPEFDLLKIDVQGGEVGTFSGARKKLNSAIAVITEAAVIAMYEGQPLLDAQMQELRKSGFAFHKFLFLKSYMTELGIGGKLRPRRLKNQAVDGDVVFLKDLYFLANFNPEKLKHLAILADSTFESFDIAVLALEALERSGQIGQTSINEYLEHLPNEILRFPPNP